MAEAGDVTLIPLPCSMGLVTVHAVQVLSHKAIRTRFEEESARLPALASAEAEPPRGHGTVVEPTPTVEDGLARLAWEAATATAA